MARSSRAGEECEFRDPFRRFCWQTGFANTVRKKEVSDMLANGRRDSEVMQVTRTTGRSGFGRGRWGRSLVWSCLRYLLKRDRAAISRQPDTRPWRSGPGWMYTPGSWGLVRGQTAGASEISQGGSIEERRQGPRGPRYLELPMMEQQLRTPGGAKSEEGGEARVNQGPAFQEGGPAGHWLRDSSGRSLRV